MDEHTQLAMALSISMMGDKEQRTTAIDLPKEDLVAKPKKRARKKKKTDEDVDEQTRIAMAMSASLADEMKQKNKDLGKNEERPGKKPRARAKGKLKKVHQEFPVLLTRQDDERQKILAERISALLESSRSEDFIISDHVFQPSRIRTKYLDPDSRPLTETYPGNIKIKSGLQLWNATGVDLSKKQTGRSPFYVEQLQPTIVPLTPKDRTSPTPHEVSSKTPTKTPCKLSPKSVAHEASVEETMSLTQSFGMTVQCLADLAEEGLHDSMSLSSDKCGFIPQETAQRADSPENQLSDDQLTLLEELSSLVNSPTMSDAVIQIDDGSKLHVHSFMIQLRCPALATLLAKSMGRNSTSLPAIVVSDICYEAMENILSYIYSASVNITGDTAAEIKRFAERFEMVELASHCTPYLQDGTDSNAARKRSELDIVDKDLNQLIDSLWEDEEDEKETEKKGDAGRTSDDDVNDPLDDDEIEAIYDVASSQRSRSRAEMSEDDGDDILAMELDYPRVSSPKKMEPCDDEMRDEDSVEEVKSKMLLTQGCRRSNTSSSHGNSGDDDDDDNEDWSMAMEDEVILHSVANTHCVTPSAKRITDESKGKIGDKLSEFSASVFPEDIVDETPTKGMCHSRRKASDSSSSRNETITNEPCHRTFEESFHSSHNKTLVSDNENDISASSMRDCHKPRKTSPKTSKIPKGSSRDVDRCDRLKVFYEPLVDDGVDRSESPEDEVLFLRTDSAESETDGQSRNLRKSQQSMSMWRTGEKTESSAGLTGEKKDLNIDDPGQRRSSALKRKKLLIQQYSVSSDSDGSRSPPEVAEFCHGDEIQVVGTEKKNSTKIKDVSHYTPSVVLKKLSMTFDSNEFGKDRDIKQKRSALQSSLTEKHDYSSSRIRLDSLDGSLSEDILSPSPPPSPKFTRTTQIPRLEKTVEDRRSPINRNSHVEWDQCRSLSASPLVRGQSSEDENDPYELSPSSSTSSRKRSKHLSSSKQKKQKKKVEQETPRWDSADNFSSSFSKSSANSKDAKRRWSSLKMDHDLPSRRSRDLVHIEGQPEILYDLSPAPTSPGVSHEISPSPSMSSSPAPVDSPGAVASPALSTSPGVLRSPAGSCRESPHSAMQDVDDVPEERFAFDMEEGCGFDDFNVEMDLPHDDGDVDDVDDDDAEIVHQEEKVVEDGDDLNRNHGIFHKNKHSEEENEIDLTQKKDEDGEEEKEDGLTDVLDHHSPAFRGRNSGCGHPIDISHKEPEQGNKFNCFGTPQVNHSQRPQVLEGQEEGSKVHHKVPQSLGTTPRTSQLTTGTVLKTPSVSRLIRDEYYPPAPITPMPNYDSMLTPELKRELKRFGVKPLGKKKSRLLLAEIFAYLHQVMPEDESDEDTSSTAKTKPEPEPTEGRSKKGKTAKQKPTTKRGQARKNLKEESSSDDRPTRDMCNRKSKVPAKKPTKPRKRKKAEGGLDETPTKRVKMESPAEEEEDQDTACRRGMGIEDSTGLDELTSSQGSHSSSFESNKSDFGESIYYEDPEDDDVVMATQQVQDMSTEVTRYITRNKELHQKILHYEVLNLEEFYKELKEAKISCSKVKLMEFLDHHCITYRHKEGSRQRKPKNAKTKR